jgi:ribonuclease P protein component
MVEFEKNTRKRLPKSERLSSHKQIQNLFSGGKTFAIHPFVVKYSIIQGQEAENHQILVSVSKRNFKRAVDRNRIKRQIREAYRLNKHIIAGLPNKYAIAYIYTFKEKIQFKNLENKLIECLSRLKNELNTRNED